MLPRDNLAQPWIARLDRRNGVFRDAVGADGDHPGVDFDPPHAGHTLGTVSSGQVARADERRSGRPDRRRAAWTAMGNGPVVDLAKDPVRPGSLARSTTCKNH